MVTLSLDGSQDVSDFTRKKLTRFLCQELLYEYVTHRLDARREQEINDFLPTCRDTSRELENLNKGLRYSQIAAQVKVTPKLKEALENFEPHWKKQLRAWTLWSSQRGWKMLPYVFVVIALALGVMVTKPWVKTLSEDVMLAEQLKKEPDMVPAPPTPLPPDAPTVSTAKTSTLPNGVAAPTLPTGVAAPPTVDSPPETVTAVKTKPSPVAAPAPTPAPLVAATEIGTAADPDTSKPATEAEQMGRGFLYRAEIEVSDFHNSWPAIRDKVVALGGKVAGNVEMGWLRKQTESYFHFTLPESNYPELELFLGTFSPVRFSKDRHPRVMPEGQIRIILTVKDGMTTNEGSSATP